MRRRATRDLPGVSDATDLSARAPVLLRLPDRAALRQMFHRRYGALGELGWGPKMRLACDYFTPDDVYEALVAGLVVEGSRWLDVGCGRDLFPNNLGLAEALSKRCARLTGVDPDPTLRENPSKRGAVHWAGHAELVLFVADAPVLARAARQRRAPVLSESGGAAGERQAMIHKCCELLLSVKKINFRRVG